MKKHIGCYPRVRVGGGGRSVVSQAGTVLRAEAVRKSGPDDAISAALAPWRKPQAVHDPGKVLLDSRSRRLRAGTASPMPPCCGPSPTRSARWRPTPRSPGSSTPSPRPDRRPPTAIRSARAEARSHIWELARANGPAADGHVIVDIDGVLVLARPEKRDADLELRHRRRARCEDRIRGARDTGLRNLSLHDTAQNRIRPEIVSLAPDLLARMPMLALTGKTRRREPRKLRLRLFSAAAQRVTTGRRRKTAGPGTAKIRITAPRTTPGNVPRTRRRVSGPYNIPCAPYNIPCAR